MEKLFSYGTLQLEEVQLATFNRKLKGDKDKLIGFNLSDLTISCSHVLALSKESVHKILIPSDSEGDIVEGIVFELTHEELLKADEYEVDDYVRIEINLASGSKAWVYAHRSVL